MSTTTTTLPAEEKEILELVDASMFETPEEQAVAARLIPVLTAKLEAQQTEKLKKLFADLRAENEKAIQAELQKLREANKPLEPAELEKLLSQEYITFQVKAQDKTGERAFTIRELPQATELKLLNILKTAITPHLKELTSKSWDKGSTAEKFQKLIETVPGMLETLAECCVLCLDPFGVEKVDKVWVQSNLSSNRVMAILAAQITAGRFRDFFSIASRSIPGLMTS